MSTVTLRPVQDQDLDALFEHLRHSGTHRIVAFPAPFPDDRAAFDAHWARLRTDRSVVIRTIEHDGDVAGHILAWDTGRVPHIAWSIDPELPSDDIATDALRLFLDRFTRRPVRARVAADDAATIRVLERCEFRRIGDERPAAPAGGDDVPGLTYELVLFPHLATS